MLVPSEKYREMHHQYEVISKRDGTFVYCTTLTVNCLAFLAMAGATFFFCTGSLSAINTYFTWLRPFAEYLPSLSSVIKNNFQYLNQSKPYLGDRYLLSMAFCLVVSAIMTSLHVFNSVLSLFLSEISPHPFYGKFSKSVLSFVLLLLFCIFIAFFSDISQRGEYPTRFQRILSTEFTIYGVMFFVFGLNVAAYYLLFTAAKIIRFGGMKYDK